MSYAIIRNAKYKMANMQSISRHNERQNKQYGNKDIDTSRSDLNYHLKKPQENSYEREFYRLREENQLKGNLRLTGKKQSNVVCEFLITSDNEFFKRLGEEETKRYFKTAYEFACKKCGEENIISAVVHMDETTPHMHLTYIPVVEGKNKNGEKVKKINCSEFWKGFNSYGELQDSFYSYVRERGFDLERGEPREEKREHLSVNEFKAETLKKEIEQLENRIDTLKNDLKAFKTVYDKVKDIKYTYEQIDDLKAKKSVLNKANVVVPEKDFERLKDAAKKSSTLQYELELIKSEADRLKDRSKRNEAVAYKYKTENEQLRDKVSELSEKITVFHRLFAKHNVSEKQVNALLKQTMKEMQAEKIQQRSKQKSWEMER